MNKGVKVQYFSQCATKTSHYVIHYAGALHVNTVSFPNRHFRSRDELISDVLLWTPSHGRAKAGWPARTFIQQLCEDTECNPGDLPEAMNDRDLWGESVRDIRADGSTI